MNQMSSSYLSACTLLVMHVKSNAVLYGWARIYLSAVEVDDHGEGELQGVDGDGGGASGPS